MVSINIIVKEYDHSDDILSKESPNFRILSHDFSKYRKTIYFHIETTEEEYMYLRLKYGSENVWLR